MKKILLLFLIPLLLGVAAAQEKSEPEPQPAGMYRLDFVIKEMDGTKVVNSRNYSMVVDAPWGIGNTAHRTSANLRAGNRVPVSVGSKDAAFQYMDVGVTVAVTLVQKGSGALGFDMNVEVSSLAQPEGQSQMGMQSGGTPVVRSERSSVAGILTPGKELVVSSIDDPVSNRRFVVAVVPTKLM